MQALFFSEFRVLGVLCQNSEAKSKYFVSYYAIIGGVRSGKTAGSREQEGFELAESKCMKTKQWGRAVVGSRGPSKPASPDF